MDRWIRGGERWARGALAAAVLFGSGVASAAPELVDRVAAVVNEDVITLSDVYERAWPMMQQLQESANPAGISERKRQELLRAALDDLIAERLLEAEQKALNIEVSDQELEYAIDDVRRQNNMDARTFEQALMAQGQTLETYKERLRKDLASMKLIGLKVRSKIKVSDEDVMAEYARRAKLDSADVEVRARHIVIQVPKGADAATEEEARKRAAELAGRARNGEDFITLARNHSEGPSREDGGDIGFFKKGDMVAAFEQAAFSLEVGGVSDPVRTPFGWHVIKVEEKRAGPTKPLEQVREELRDRLFKEQMQRHTEAYVDELRRNAIIDVKIPELDSRKSGGSASNPRAAP